MVKLICVTALLTIFVTAHAAVISSSPYHFVLEQGQTAATTVGWSAVDAGQTVQIYVSINGGADTLIHQQQGSGSVSYAGISLPNLYVFKLFQDTSHTSLLCWVSVSTQRGPACGFGCNYLPTHLGWFNNTNYTTTNKNRLQQDLMQMMSLEGNTIRFNYWLTGCALDGANNRWIFNPEFFEIVNNMVNWLSTVCYDNNVRVYIAFHNDWFVHGPDDGTGRKWWETYPGMTIDGFIAGAAQWMTHVVSAVEANTKARQVVFGYDFQNEIAIDASFPNIVPYLTYCYDHVPVPKGKFMASFSNKIQVANWPLQMGGRRLDYVDLHYYPDAQSSGDQPQQFAYWVNLARQSCPDAKIIMGEYGQVGGSSFPSAEGTYPSNEYNQAHKMIGLADAAVANGLLGHLAWDFIPPATVTEPSYGMTYYDSGGSHKPKDVIGDLSSFNQTLYNPDAEIDSGGVPDGWSASSNKAFVFTQAGPTKASAVTNSYYAKLTMSATVSTDWAQINTPGIENPYIGGKKIYVNAYIRSNMKHRIRILEYNSSNQLINTLTGTQIIPSTTSWNSYQHKVGPWALTLNANTRAIVVQVYATRNTTDAAYVEVDAVSVYAPGLERRPLTADINRDWSVDMDDLLIFAGQWLHQWEPYQDFLIHRYSFNGNCNDSVGEAHGTLIDYNSSAVWQSGALYLNNAAGIVPTSTTQGAHINLPSGLLAGLEQATILMWLETPVDFDGSYLLSFGGGKNGDGPSYGPELTVQNRSSSRLATHWNQSGSWYGHDLSGYPNPSGPAFYALTIEEDIMAGFRPNPWDMGDRLRVFVDGTWDSEFTGPNWEGPGLYDPINWFETANHIGKSWQSGYKGNVILDEIRIYSVALTAEQIAAEYVAGPNQVFAYSVPWDFNDDGIISMLDFVILAQQWAISD